MECTINILSDEVNAADAQSAPMVMIDTSAKKKRSRWSELIVNVFHRTTHSLAFLGALLLLSMPRLLLFLDVCQKCGSSQNRYLQGRVVHGFVSLFLWFIAVVLLSILTNDYNDYEE